MILLQADRSILVNALGGVLAPAGVAALVLALAARPWRGRAGEGAAGWGAPLALGLAFAAGYIATQGWPDFPPGALVKQWLFYVGLGGGFFGAYEGLAEQPKRLARGLASAAAPVLLLGFMREHHWTRTESFLWTAGLAGTLFASWSALETLAIRRPGAMLPLALGLSTACSAGVLHYSGSSASLAPLAGSLVPALCACALLGFLRPGFGLSHGGIAPFVLLYSGLLWAGHFASELGGRGFALLLIAPLLSWFGELVPGSRPRLRLGLSFAAPVATSLVALLIARAAAPPSSPYG